MGSCWCSSSWCFAHDVLLSGSGPVDSPSKPTDSSGQWHCTLKYLVSGEVKKINFRASFHASAVEAFSE